MICFGWFHVWDQGYLKCLRCVEVLGQRGLESRGTGTMWVIVQVENVSTCVVEEADMNDFGVLLYHLRTTARGYSSSPGSVGPLFLQITFVQLFFTFFYSTVLYSFMPTVTTGKGFYFHAAVKKHIEN